MDLRSDLKRFVVESLHEMGATFDPNADAETLLIAALTIEERQILATPRSVHTTPEFNAAALTLTAEYQSGVAEIRRKFETGEDVNPHLNRRSLQPSDDDDLLTDWGIYHFHLGLKMLPGNRFVERSGPLAFGHVTVKDVYLIDILSHGKFAEPKLIATLLRRFPNIADAHEIRLPKAPEPDKTAGGQITAFPLPATASEVTTFRKIHVNVPVIVDGKLYFGPGGGFVASGANSRAVDRMNATLKWIDALEGLLSKEGESVRRQIAAKRPGIVPAQLEFELACYGREWLLFEKVTGSLIRFESQANSIRTPYPSPRTAPALPVHKTSPHFGSDG